MKVCDTCNITFADNIRYCTHCGKELPDQGSTSAQEQLTIDSEKRIQEEKSSHTSVIIKTISSFFIALVAAFIWTAAGSASGLLVVLVPLITSIFVFINPEKYGEFGSFAFGASIIFVVMSIIYSLLSLI